MRFTTPYRILGPLSNPSIDYSRMGLAGRAIGELAMTPFNLLGSLTSLVTDWGRDRENPCLTWTQSGTAGGTPPPASAATGASGLAVIDMPPATYVATTGSHIRAGPGTSYSIIDKIPKGTTVQVTGKVKGLDWYRISLAGGGVGYISAALLTPADWPNMQ